MLCRGCHRGLAWQLWFRVRPTTVLKWPPIIILPSGWTTTTSTGPSAFGSKPSNADWPRTVAVSNRNSRAIAALLTKMLLACGIMCLPICAMRANVGTDSRKEHLTCREYSRWAVLLGGLQAGIYFDQFRINCQRLHSWLPEKAWVRTGPVEKKARSIIPQKAKRRRQKPGHHNSGQ